MLCWVQMEQASSAFAGVSFHCYSGSVSQQDTFHNAYPSKEVYFTECAGTQGSDWWSDIKVRGYPLELSHESIHDLILVSPQWYMDNL